MQWILNKNSKKNIKTEEKNQGHNCRKPSETAVKHTIVTIHAVGNFTENMPTN